MEQSERSVHTPRDTIKVLQWNVQGLRNKRPEVVQSIVEEGYDLVLLQETLVPEDFKWRVAGFTVHSLPCGGDGQRGQLHGVGAKQHPAPQDS